jgi:ATP-dependent DNA helicase MPH1
MSDGEDDDNEDGGNAQETRAMVFVTNRGCVDEIEEMLNEERPLIRATRFIGQGTDKQGKRGFAQKEQLDVGFLYFAFFLCENILLRFRCGR